MVVLSHRTIREIIEEYPDAEDALNNWYVVTEQCDWSNFHDVKKIFNSVDAVGNDLYVFDIKGKHYRLIARIIFRVRTVFVKFVGTHKQYDRIALDSFKYNGQQQTFVMTQRKMLVRNEKEYQAAMARIDVLMEKGERHLTQKEADDLESWALAAQTYEKSMYAVPAPKTIAGMIELKMYEKKLKQKDLARIMGLGEAKLSQILNGKRDPDVAFLKAAHQKLGIDAAFLLSHV